MLFRDVHLTAHLTGQLLSDQQNIAKSALYCAYLTGHLTAAKVFCIVLPCFTVFLRFC